MLDCSKQDLIWFPSSAWELNVLQALPAVSVSRDSGFRKHWRGGASKTVRSQAECWNEWKTGCILVSSIGPHRESTKWQCNLQQPRTRGFG
jgi:hypothetical protein